MRPSSSAGPGPASGLDFRRAGLADAPTLARLRVEFVRIVKDGGIPDEAGYEAALARYFAGGLRRGRLLAWLCLDGGEAVASAALRIDRGRRPGQAERGYVMSVFTREPYRRRGLASRLLGLLIEEARARGLERLSLHPTADGLPLYLGLGFRPFRTVMILPLPGEGRSHSKKEEP